VPAKFLWTSLKEALGWDRPPDSLEDSFDHWLPIGCTDYIIKAFLFGVVLWGLWNVRNKLSIEGMAPKSPTDILYNILSLLQRWGVLLRRPEKIKLEKRTSSVWNWVKRFQGKIKSRSPLEDLL
jgi:hypothetical protein